MARPLHDLIKKDVPWQWTQEQQKVFDSIKEMFCTEPILKVYDPELSTRVKCDASSFAMGGILSQKHKDDLWHPVTYCSQLMSKEEHNYKIYNREILGLICALEDWQHFLEGITFKVITDHKNMEWWMTM